MKKLYTIWIKLKYQYYKLYWKIRPPKQKRSKFYGWSEVNYNVLDKTAIGYGVIKR